MTFCMFNRSQGHGSGCTTALSGMYCYLTQHTSLRRDTKPAQINSGVDTKTVPQSPRSKLNVLAALQTLSQYVEK